MRTRLLSSNFTLAQRRAVFWCVFCVSVVQFKERLVVA